MRWELELTNGVTDGWLMQGGQGIMEAVEMYNKAVEIDEQCQSAYLHHAQLKLQLGAREEAIGLYDKAIEWAKTQAELVEVCVEFSDLAIFLC